MRKLVFAIMVLFVIFSFIKGFAETGKTAEKIALETRTELTGL